MDNKRIFLWAAAGLLLWLNFITWQRAYPPAEPQRAQAPSSVAEDRGELPTLPKEAAPTVTLAAQDNGVNNPVPVPSASQASVIRVTTDVLAVDISTQGGELRRADLLKYPREKKDPNTPVRLLSADPQHIFLARSGLLSTDQQAAPTHLAVFTTASPDYRLQPGANELPVKLTWTDGKGITVTKTYTFRRGQYAIDLQYEVLNQSPNAWQGASYLQLLRHHEPMKTSMFNAETYAYRGPAIFDGKAYRKLKLDDKDDQNYQAAFASGWMAAMQHHFVVAAVPPIEPTYDYSLKLNSSNEFTLTYRGPLQAVASGASGIFAERLFVGPKLQSQLEAAGPRLELTADYGKLTIIAQPLFWLLEKVHDLLGNWGWAIVIVTLLIKLAFYKLTAASGRSMAKMRNLTPRIKAIQERFKDDREQLGRAMMDLYKKEKINPLAGCLPILIQIPVFMGFYWVLLESVEMRQAPFFGWITDLSARDPYFILPIIMGIANYVQFKLNPAPPDPMQAKVFAFMPIVMTVMMAWFPSGMVLYWITNTVLSALQQWRINQVIAADNKHAAA